MNFKITAFSLVFIILAVLSLSFFMDNVSIKEGAETMTSPVVTPDVSNTTTPRPTTTAPTTKSGYSILESTLDNISSSKTPVPTTVVPVSYDRSIYESTNECDITKPIYKYTDPKCDKNCKNTHVRWKKCGYPEEICDISKPEFEYDDPKCDYNCKYDNIAWRKCYPN
jgi:hypothetical protein